MELGLILLNHTISTRASWPNTCFPSGHSKKSHPKPKLKSLFLPNSINRLLPPILHVWLAQIPMPGNLSPATISRTISLIQGFHRPRPGLYQGLKNAHTCRIPPKSYHLLHVFVFLYMFNVRQFDKFLQEIIRQGSVPPISCSDTHNSLIPSGFFSEQCVSGKSINLSIQI